MQFLPRMPMTGHGVFVCEGCAKVLTQCRCIGPHKHIPQGKCDDCKAAAPLGLVLPNDINLIRQHIGAFPAMEALNRAEKELNDWRTGALKWAPHGQNRFDFYSHLIRMMVFSLQTFGPGARAQGVVEHIRKELKEIEAAPGDLKEWVDVIILGIDGAWRSGASAQQIIDALVGKQDINEARKWPDWRTQRPDQAIEHIRDEEPTA